MKNFFNFNILAFFPVLVFFDLLFLTLENRNAVPSSSSSSSRFLRGVFAQSATENAGGPQFFYGDKDLFNQNVDIVVGTGFTTTDQENAPCGIEIYNIENGGRFNISGQNLGNGCYIRITDSTFVTLEISVAFDDGSLFTNSQVYLENVKIFAPPESFGLKIANYLSPSYLYSVQIIRSKITRNVRAGSISPSAADSVCTYSKLGSAQRHAICIQASSVRAVCSQIRVVEITDDSDSDSDSDSSASSSDSSSTSLLPSHGIRINSTDAPSIYIDQTIVECNNWNVAHVIGGLFVAGSSTDSAIDTTCYNITITNSVFTAIAAPVSSSSILQMLNYLIFVAVVPQFLTMKNVTSTAVGSADAHAFLVTSQDAPNNIPLSPLVWLISRSNVTGIRGRVDATALEEDSTGGAVMTMFFTGKYPVLVRSIVVEFNSFTVTGDAQTYAMQLYADNKTFASSLQETSEVYIVGNSIKVTCGIACNGAALSIYSLTNCSNLTVVANNTISARAGGGTMSGMQLVKGINFWSSTSSSSLIVNNNIISLTTFVFVSYLFGFTLSDISIQNMSFFNNSIQIRGSASYVYGFRFSPIPSKNNSDIAENLQLINNNVTLIDTVRSEQDSQTFVSVFLSNSVTNALNISSNYFHTEISSQTSLPTTKVIYILPAVASHDIAFRDFVVNDNVAISTGKHYDFKFVAIFSASSIFSAKFYGATISGTLQAKRNNIRLSSNYSSNKQSAAHILILAYFPATTQATVKNLDFSDNILLFDSPDEPNSKSPSKPSFVGVQIDAYASVTDSILIAGNNMTVNNFGNRDNSSTVRILGTATEFPKLKVFTIENNTIEMYSCAIARLILLNDKRGGGLTTFGFDSSLIYPQAIIRNNKIHVKNDFGFCQVMMMFCLRQVQFEGATTSMIIEKNNLTVYAGRHLDTMHDADSEGISVMLYMYNLSVQNFYFRNNYQHCSGPRIANYVSAINIVPFALDYRVQISGELVISNNYCRAGMEMWADMHLGITGTATISNNIIENTLESLNSNNCDDSDNINWVAHKYFLELRSSVIKNTITIENNIYTFGPIVSDSNLVLLGSAKKDIPNGKCLVMENTGFQVAFLHHSHYIDRMNEPQAQLRVSFMSDPNAKIIVRNNVMNATGFRSRFYGSASFLMFDRMHQGLVIIPSGSSSSSPATTVARFDFQNNIGQFSVFKNASLVSSPNNTVMLFVAPSPSSSDPTSTFNFQSNTILLDSNQAPQFASLTLGAGFFPMVAQNNLIRIVGSSNLPVPLSTSSTFTPKYKTSQMSHFCFACTPIIDLKAVRIASSIPITPTIILKATYKNNVVGSDRGETNSDLVSFWLLPNTSLSASSSNAAPKFDIEMTFASNAIQVLTENYLTPMQNPFNSPASRTIAAVIGNDGNALATLNQVRISKIAALLGSPCNRMEFFSIPGQLFVTKYANAKMFESVSLMNSAEIEGSGDSSCSSSTKTKTFFHPPPAIPSRTKTIIATTSPTSTSTTNNGESNTTKFTSTTVTNAANGTNVPVTTTSSPNTTQATTTTTTTTTTTIRPRTKTMTRVIPTPPPGLSEKTAAQQTSITKGVNAAATAIAAPTAALAAARGLAVFALLTCNKDRKSDVVDIISDVVLTPLLAIPIFVGLLVASTVVALGLGMLNERSRRRDEQREMDKRSQDQLLCSSQGFVGLLGASTSAESTATSPRRTKNNKIKNVHNNAVPQQTFLLASANLAPFPAVLIKVLSQLIPFWSVAAGLLVGAGDPGSISLGVAPLALLVIAGIGVIRHVHGIIHSPNGPRLVRSLAHRPPDAGAWTQSLVEFFLHPAGRFAISGWYCWSAPRTKNLEDYLRFRVDERGNEDNNDDDGSDEATREKIVDEYKNRRDCANLLIRMRAVLTKFWGPHLESEAEDLRSEAQADFGLAPSSRNKRRNSKQLFGASTSASNVQMLMQGNAESTNGDTSDDDDEEKLTGISRFCGNPDFSSKLYYFRQLLCPHFVILSAFFTVLVGVIQGVALKTSNEDVCRKSMIVIAVLNLLCWLMGLILRPFIVPLKNVVSISVDTVIVVASFLGAVVIGGNMEEHASMIAPIQYACALSASIGGGILVLLTLVKFLCMRVFRLSMVPRVEIIRRAAEELRNIPLIIATTPKEKATSQNENAKKHSSSPTLKSKKEDNNEQNNNNSDKKSKTENKFKSPELYSSLLESPKRNENKKQHKGSRHEKETEESDSMFLLSSPALLRAELSSSDLRKQQHHKSPSRSKSFSSPSDDDDLEEPKELVLPSAIVSRHHHSSSKTPRSPSSKKKTADHEPREEKEEKNDLRCETSKRSPKEKEASQNIRPSKR